MPILSSPVDKTLIPTGEFRDVTGTPFDFKTSKAIGIHIDNENIQLKKWFRYDHCWVLNDQDTGVRFVASAYEPVSGRLLEVFSDEPGIQFYSGNFLDAAHCLVKTKGCINIEQAFVWKPSTTRLSQSKSLPFRRSFTG